MLDMNKLTVMCLRNCLKMKVDIIVDDDNAILEADVTFANSSIMRDFLPSKSNKGDH